MIVINVLALVWLLLRVTNNQQPDLGALSKIVPGTLLTPKQVSDLIAVPLPTLRYWRHVQRGPAVIKVGRLCRYDPSDLRDWLEAQRTANDSPAG